MTKIADIIEELGELKSFVAHPGWTLLLRYRDAGINHLRDSNELVPISDLADLYRKEFINGEIKGLKTLTGLVETQIRTLSSIVEESRRKELRDGEEEDDSES